MDSGGSEIEKDKCPRCADCCRAINLPLLALIAPDLFCDEGLQKFMEIWGIRERLKENQLMTISLPCQHLKDGACDIYEERPPTCRNYLCKKGREYGVIHSS